jgi:predicted SnoaL-like aldol condensation-catalyzing enzyme
MNDESSRKRSARDFLRRCARGDVDEAYRLYVHAEFRHHNVHFPGDRDSLRRAMIDAAAAVPDKSIETPLVIEEGDLVSTLSHVRMGSANIVVSHIFRFEGERVAELWDVGQVVPPDSPNVHGPV